MEAAPTGVGWTRHRLFRPVLWWAVVSSLLFLWRFHYRHAAQATLRFTISLEGRTERPAPEGVLNGRYYRAGEPSGVGWRALRVQVPDYEPFATNRFVWYGGAELGDLRLSRSRGLLELDLAPAAETVQLLGPEAGDILSQVTRKALPLPTGRYAVRANYKHFTVERTVEVLRNTTNRLTIAPRLTALNLTADPETAEFELRGTGQPEVVVSGRTPSVVTDLPAGEYALAIARGHYRKELPVILGETRTTNELKVAFRYARVSVTSEPPDAAIREGDKVIGRTPVQFDLPPGSYQWQIGKDGYFGTNVSLSLTETDTKSVSVALGNVSFLAALERARNHASGFAPDYDAALADLDQALLIKPGDGTALGLKRTVQYNRHLRTARRLQGEGRYGDALAETEAALQLDINEAEASGLKRELERSLQAVAAARAEARRNRPLKLLPELSAKIKYDELFTPQVLRFNGLLDVVRGGVVRALGRKPAWTVTQNVAVDDDTAVIRAELKNLGSRYGVVAVVGQTAEHEVTVCFKLFAYLLGDNIQFTLQGITEDSYLPMHPQFVGGLRAATIESTRAHDLQEFKKRLEDEFR